MASFLQGEKFVTMTRVTGTTSALNEIIYTYGGVGYARVYITFLGSAGVNFQIGGHTYTISSDASHVTGSEVGDSLPVLMDGMRTFTVGGIGAAYTLNIFEYSL